MHEGIHPAYREVVFRDAANGTMFKTRSTLDSSQTVEWAGDQRVLDTAGRVERFRQCYGGRERPTGQK